MKLLQSPVRIQPADIIMPIVLQLAFAAPRKKDRVTSDGGFDEFFQYQPILALSYCGN